VDRVRRAAFDRQRCFLSTPNLSSLIGCLSDQGYCDSVNNSEISVTEDMPLVWMARLLGIPIGERVSGLELFEVLCRDPAHRMSVCFFGGPEEMAERACQKLDTEGGSAVAFHEEPR
jgi:N-acetylglucosaminyldiphosphoundecaprenol N-acetyl-beta-D-mannosaminyltransferase